MCTPSLSKQIEVVEDEVTMPAEADDTTPPVLDCEAAHEANKGLKSDAESLWIDFPKGAKDLVPTEPGLFIPTETIADPQNYGFGEILTMFIKTLPLFSQDNDYHWNLWESVSSSYVLAADFLLKRKDQEAIVMMFVAALLEECQARGMFVIYTAFGLGLGLGSHQGCQAVIRLEVLFNKFAYIHRAVEISRSRKAMAAFLKEWLGTDIAGQCWVPRLDSMSEQDLSAEPIHIFTTFTFEPEEWITIRIKGGTEIEAYQDTSIQWLFNYAIACINYHPPLFKLLSGMSRIRPRNFPCPCIYIAEKQIRVYLVSSATKTLRELGFEDGDTVEIGDGRQLFAKVESEPKPDHQRRNEIKRRAKKPSGRRKAKKTSTPRQEPSLEALRELHSSAMEPVLNELRPMLKKIKEHIHALSLVNDCPKKRRPGVRGKGKENALNLERSPVPIQDSVGGKAGKSAYPILVGEATDLFKTAQLRPRKALRRIALDLHGCSRYKALGLLRKSLVEWIDVAMKGDYPFVVAVDIICGGGNQVLSGVVAQFIRNSPQIANRPKSIK